MKMKIGLFILSALWIATLALWHIDHVALTKIYQDYELKWGNQALEDENRIESLKSSNERITEVVNALENSYFDLEAKNQQLSTLNVSMNDSLARSRIESAAQQISLQNEKNQNDLLRATAITPAPTYTITPAQPPPWEIHTTTTGTIIHPNGSMSEIYMDTQ